MSPAIIPPGGTLLTTGLALFGRDLTVTLTNRAWVLLLQLGAITPPVVSLLVWTGAIARGATPPIPADRLVTWFVLVAVVSMVTSSWTASFLAEDIRTGGLSIWLVRPCPALAHLVSNNLAEKTVKIAVLLPMVAALGALFRDQVQLPWTPRSGWRRWPPWAAPPSWPSCSTCSSAAWPSGSRTSTECRAS